MPAAHPDFLPAPTRQRAFRPLRSSFAASPLDGLPLQAFVDFDEPEPAEEFDDDEIDEEDDEQAAPFDVVWTK